ncbi:hypothetical protein HN51_038542 [Arachis hypogaea]
MEKDRDGGRDPGRRRHAWTEEVRRGAASRQWSCVCIADGEVLRGGRWSSLRGEVHGAGEDERRKEERHYSSEFLVFMEERFSLVTVEDRRDN